MLIELQPEEIGPLSYVTGYVLQSLYRKSKNSLHWDSTRSQELQFLLQSMRLPSNQEDNYVHSMSRGGLWAPTEPIREIAKAAELMFRKYLKAQKTARSFPTNKVVDKILEMPSVRSLWDNIVCDLDSPISSECNKVVLENFVKLYVQVRSFSYAKDIVSKHKMKGKSDKKALRKDLKSRDSST